jgi:tetratricopeptide (TPR) repeat protein
VSVDDLIRAGEYGRALELARAELDAVRSTTHDPGKLAPYLNQVGLAGKYAGAFEEAEVAYREALRLARAAGDLRAQVAVLHNLGGLGHARADHAWGESWARAGLELRRRHLRDDPEGLAADEAALAALAEGLERFDEAEALYRSALATWRAVGNSYEVAVCLNGLATVLRLTGRTDYAEPILREALAAMADERGDTHPETSTLRNNLAMLLQATRRADQALPLLERAAADLTAVLGPDHPATRDVVTNRVRVARVLATP